MQFHVLSFEGPDGYSRAGAFACTGISGEDYAVPGRNALVLQTPDPREFVGLFRRLKAHPAQGDSIRRAGRSTAKQYAWPEIIERLLLPRLDLLFWTKDSLNRVLLRLHIPRVIATLALAAATACVNASTSATGTPRGRLAGPLERAPVVLDGRTIFEVGSTEALTASNRARLISEALQRSVTPGEPQLEPAREGEGGTILADGRDLLTASERDLTSGRTPAEQSMIWAKAAEEALRRARHERTPTYLAQAIPLGIGALVAALVSFWGLGRAGKRFPLWVARGRGLARPSSGVESVPWQRGFELALLVPRITLVATAAYFVTDLLPQVRAARYAAWRLLENSLTSSLFQVGSRVYSPLDLLLLPTLVIALSVAVSLFTRALRVTVLGSASSDRSVQETVVGLIRYLLFFVGALVLLQISGVDLSALAIPASALGLGLGFGLQNIANNFVSGVVINLERRFKAGDFVQIGQFLGTVESIGARSTEIRTGDRISVVVPNSYLLEREVVNWSLGDPIARLHVPIGVAYGADVTVVRTALLEAARSHRCVLANPPPQVRLVRFGDSALEFELLVWTQDPRDHSALRSDLNYRIDAIFRRTGIEIPFPQRDLHLPLDALAAVTGRLPLGATSDFNVTRARATSPIEQSSRTVFEDVPTELEVREFSESDLEAVRARMRGEDGIQISDRRYFLALYPKCFVGREAVDWLVRREGLNRRQAVRVGQQLMEHGLLRHVLDEHDFEDGTFFYRFREDEPAAARGIVEERVDRV